MYFPNMQGQSLKDYDDRYQDIVHVLRGKTSIVSVVSEQWAELQCNSYTNPAENPALAVQMERLKEQGLQRVFLSIEESRLKAALVRLFWHHWRKLTPEHEWARTFLIQRGLTDYTRQDLYIKNSRIGYVYLVDADCKIRWAGCGDATDVERASLVDAAVRLVEPASTPSSHQSEPISADSQHAAKTPARALGDWQKKWDAIIGGAKGDRTT